MIAALINLPTWLQVGFWLVLGPLAIRHYWKD